MHAILAHAYRLALHVLTLQLWRPPAATLAVALALRLSGVARSARGAALACLGAVLAGWLLLDPHWVGLHPPPLARLPGLAVILLVEAALRAGSKPRLAWLTGLLCAAVGAWWLRGAPVTWPPILYCVPVFLGLAAGLPVSCWLARNDDGLGWPRGVCRLGRLADGDGGGHALGARGRRFRDSRSGAARVAAGFAAGRRGVGDGGRHRPLPPRTVAG